MKNGELFCAKELSTGVYYHVHAVPRRCEAQIESIKLEYRKEALDQSQCVSMRQSSRAKDGRIYLLVDIKSTMNVMDAWGADVEYFSKAKQSEACQEEDDFDLVSSTELDDMPAPKSPETPC